MLNKIFMFVALLYCFLASLLLIDYKDRYEKLSYEYEAKGLIHQAEKEKLEKEIRLLKTDLRIAQEGYEGGKENGKN